MKTLLAVLVIIIGGAGAYYAVDYPKSTLPHNNAIMPIKNASSSVEVIPISHATFELRWDNTVFLNDPVGSGSTFSQRPMADIVLVSDIHDDHFSTSTLERVVDAGALFIVPQAVADLLPPDLKARAKVMKNGDTFSERGFTFTAIPMYNIPESDKAFHTKGRGNGYLIEKNGKRVYIAGDTSNTPEMRALTNIDIAFIPMNLPYTMGVEEAAQAVLAFKPRDVYPYHFRGQDGLSDVEKFKKLVKDADPAIRVDIMKNWYSQP